MSLNTKMKIKIEFSTENAAFDPDPAEEIKRIINKYIALINVQRLNSARMLDLNGNYCGTITIVNEK